MNVRFGIEKTGSNFLLSSSIIEVFLGRNGKKFASCNCGIFEICGNEEKMICNIKLVSSLYICQYDMCIGILESSYEFVFIDINDNGCVHRSGVFSPEKSMCRLVFYPLHNVLLHIGSGFTSWKIQKAFPFFTIDFYGSFSCSYNVYFTNPLCYNINIGTILMPTPTGIMMYTLLGEEFMIQSKYPTTSDTLFSYYCDTNEVVTYDITFGICLWDSKANLLNQYDLGFLRFISISFINPQFLLCIDSQFSVYILNLKNKKHYYCGDVLKGYSRIHILCTNPFMFSLSKGSTFETYNVTIPFHIWNIGIDRTCKIINKHPCNFSEPVIIENKFSLSLYSSDTSSQLSQFLPNEGYSIISSSFVSIDEGKSSHINIVLDDGSLYRIKQFDGAKKIEGRYSLNACLVYTYIEDKIVHEIIGTRTGYLYTNCSDNFNNYRCISINNEPIQVVSYDSINKGFLILCSSIVYYINNEYILGEIIQIDVDYTCCLHNNRIYIGKTSGQLDVIEVRDSHGISISKNPEICYHSGKVISFSFSPTFWISCGIDNSIQLWDYNNINFSTVTLPFSICSCYILNSNRDILIISNKECVKIDGSIVFGTNHQNSNLSPCFNEISITQLDNDLIRDNPVTIKSSTEAVEAVEIMEPKTEIEIPHPSLKNIGISPDPIISQRAYYFKPRSFTPISNRFKKILPKRPKTPDPQEKPFFIPFSHTIINLELNIKQTHKIAPPQSVKPIYNRIKSISKTKSQEQGLTMKKSIPSPRITQQYEHSEYPYYIIQNFSPFHADSDKPKISDQKTRQIRKPFLGKTKRQSIEPIGSIEQSIVISKPKVTIPSIRRLMNK